MNKTFCILLYAMMFCVATGTALAQSGTAGALAWRITDGTLTITGNGNMPDYDSSSPAGFIYHHSVMVPEYDREPELPPWYSYQNSITELVIANGVTSIGANAFSHCESLLSIHLSGSVTTIGDKAFYLCRHLTSVSIPESVTAIEMSAFAYCSALKSIKAAPCSPSWSSEHGVLFNKDKTSLIQYPQGRKEKSYTIPESVTSIGNMAFYDCGNLTSIVIPNSVTAIGDEAFCGCNRLTFVTIPNSVTAIGNRAFNGCDDLTFIKTEPDSPNWSNEDGILFNSDKTSLIRYPKGKKGTSYTVPSSVTAIGDEAFYGCTNLTSIVIPNSVTAIGKAAFYGCTNLTPIAIHNSVTAIEDEVFAFCDDLTSIVIPNSVTVISDRAFYRCRYLTSITIPESVTYIGDRAFYRCGNLASIEVAQDNPSYSSEEGVLFNKDKTTLIQCPDVKTGEYAIPNSVTSIGDYAFASCYELTSVSIPNSVTSIGDKAFYGCSGFTSIVIPHSVTAIGDRAFYACYSLESIEVAAGNLSWSSEHGVLFNRDKTSLIHYPQGRKEKSYTIPESVTAIAGRAFYFCDGLTSITLPELATSIDKMVFHYCANLKYIKVASGNPSYSSSKGVLFNKDKTSLIQYPKKKKQRHYTIPGSVTAIRNFAFRGCLSLTSVTIPESVTVIGAAAFDNCNSLTEIINHAAAPQAMGTDVFPYNMFFYPIRGIPVLRVPVGSEEAYRAANVWKKFVHIEAIK
jgi:hypothetical protein